jgi:hypothetical protein
MLRRAILAPERPHQPASAGVTIADSAKKAGTARSAKRRVDIDILLISVRLELQYF